MSRPNSIAKSGNRQIVHQRADRAVIERRLECDASRPRERRPTAQTSTPRNVEVVACAGGK
jgi:hypothetical protein